MNLRIAINLIISYVRTKKTDNVDWTTIVEIFSNSYCTAYKFASGLLITQGQIIVPSPDLTVQTETVSFPVAYVSNPTVTAGLFSSSTSYSLGSLSAGASAVSTTSVSLRVFNNGAGARTPDVSFIAIGTWK